MLDKFVCRDDGITKITRDWIFCLCFVSRRCCPARSVVELCYSCSSGFLWFEWYVTGKVWTATGLQGQTVHSRRAHTQQQIVNITWWINSLEKGMSTSQNSHGICTSSTRSGSSACTWGSLLGVGDFDFSATNSTLFCGRSTFSGDFSSTLVFLSDSVTVLLCLRISSSCSLLII